MLNRTLSFLGRFGCHQVPDRCFRFRGEPMPFCARCLGVVIGQTAALTLALWADLPGYQHCVILTLPMAVDWGLQRFSGVLSTNWRRLTTGLLGGFGLSSLMLKLIIETARAVL